MNKDIILKKIKPFEDKKMLVALHQGTNDIVNGLMNTHEQYKQEYDKICEHFIANDIETICSNIWYFLKNNCPYKIESAKKQYLRSPGAILMDSSGVDCKSYALFTAGVLCALQRKYNLNYDVFYRFSGYNGKKDIEHVFIVVKNRKNIWFIDPVLHNFDDRTKLPTYYYDKKCSKNMALYQLSGIQQQPKQVAGLFDFVKDILTGTVGQGLFDGGSTSRDFISPYYPAVINKLNLRNDVYNGYDRGAFLNCKLDNSTYHWKCIRNKHLNSWQPIDRMLWYLQGLNSREIPVEWVETYADGYGHKPDSDKVSNDERLLPYNLVEVWNDTIKRLTNDSTRLQQYLIDETITEGYDPSKSIKKVNVSENPTTQQPATPKKSAIGLGLGALLLALTLK